MRQNIKGFLQITFWYYVIAIAFFSYPYVDVNMLGVITIVSYLYVTMIYTGFLLWCIYKIFTWIELKERVKIIFRSPIVIRHLPKEEIK